MIIDFDKMPEQIIKSFLGGEKELCARMQSDDMNKILYGKLIPGATIGMHTHDTSSEIIYIISGSGKVLYDDGEEALSEGMCHYCPKGHSHSLMNNGTSDLIFFAVVPQQ